MKNRELIVEIANDEGKMADALAVRHTVFVVEQMIDEVLERDELDAEAIHVVGYLEAEPVAAGRAVIEGGSAKIGRMAVLKAQRGKGFGVDILQALEEACKDQGIWVARLNAQEHAAGFYSQAGYHRVEGTQPFLEAGIRHIMMKKDLSR
ncbi:MAG: GNAT family N-acetyltransferase [bacterium]|nr:GNAT family N-acetyltransferase [bacterium]